METSFAAAVLLFWACAAAAAFTYVGYPVALWLLARLAGRRRQPPCLKEADFPSVSLVIAAYNEETEIASRLENALAMDYPRDKLEIVVASDGSSDATCDIVRGFATRGVRLLDYPERRGKPAVLNATVGRLHGSIILFSDANTCIAADALRCLVRWFADPTVGVVCGKLVLSDPATGRNADGMYWKYETFLKRHEGELDALLGANGAIYALRKELYVPLPDGTIVDDLVIPLLARLRGNCSVIYDEEAVAHEETPAGLGAEFRRRARIGAGGFQSLGVLWRLLDPRHGWIALSFLAHKVLRWLCPLLLLALLVTNLCLWNEPFYQYALVAQVSFYTVSLLAGLLPPRLRLLKPLRLAAMFTGMNAALLLGFGRWLCGRQKAAWERTVRVAEMEGVTS
jgi:cellulose synthase/poly-beta-1,6-N-acetylglucosamine synthase-like glycosyltransferase